MARTVYTDKHKDDMESLTGRQLTWTSTMDVLRRMDAAFFYLTPETDVSHE